MPFVSYAQQQIKALLQVRQQSSSSSPTLTFHPSLTPAGSSAPQEPTWDSPPTRLIETIVGMSHPRGFCLQGFPPCCKDTICASPPPSLAFSSPPHMETSKQPTRPSQQQMCCNKHCSTRSVCTQGSTWNAQLMDSYSPVPGKGATVRALEGTNFVDSLSTLPSFTHNSLNNYRKPQKFLSKGWPYTEMPQAIFLQAFAYGKKRSTNEARAQDAKGKLNPCELLISCTVLDLTK